MPILVNDLIMTFQVQQKFCYKTVGSVSFLHFFKLVNVSHCSNKILHK